MAAALQEQKRKHEEQRKARAAREVKEKELELRLRKQRLEEAQREEERQARKEAERQAKLKAIATREAQQRDALLYGPKKAKSENAKQREPKSGGSRSSRSSRSSQSPETSTGPILTREELREQKKQAEMRRTYADTSSTSKRTNIMTPSKRKMVKTHLAGGAVPIVTTTVGLPANLNELQGKTIKERIASVPLTLTKLNINKRDLRTIDEIIRERERVRESNKVIVGAEAKGFSDWFSKGKKNDNKEKESSPFSAPSRTETPPVSLPSSSQTSSNHTPPRMSSVSSTSTAVAPAKPITATLFLPPKPAASKFAPTAKALAKPAGIKTLSSAPAAAFIAKKRPRSSSNTPEPVPKRRALDSGTATAAASATRRSYLPDDVYSLITGGRAREARKYEDEEYDSSDMEADVFSQEKEERIRFVCFTLPQSISVLLMILLAFGYIVLVLLRKRTRMLFWRSSVMRRRSVANACRSSRSLLLGRRINLLGFMRDCHTPAGNLRRCDNYILPFQSPLYSSQKTQIIGLSYLKSIYMYIQCIILSFFLAVPDAVCHHPSVYLV